MADTTDWTTVEPTTETAPEAVAAAKAALDKVDSNLSKNKPMPNGYRAGVEMLSAIREQIEDRTGDDLSEWNGPLVYRGVRFYRSMQMMDPLAVVERS